MGKNQSASNLPNIIQYNNGSINFVSGSTLLMQISSSGAITTTGVISGSNALSSSYAVSSSYSQNSELLDNLDSTSFVFTSSYNTDSSSVSTRVSKIEGNYATTGSNIFMGAQTVCANITSTGTIIAQTLNVQQVTSSVVYSSGSNVFGCSLTNTQQFTGSVTITGSLNTTGTICSTGNTCFGGSSVVTGCLGVGIASTTSAGGNTIMLYDASTPRIRLANTTTGTTSTDGGELSLFACDFNIENREASGAMNLYVNGALRQKIFNTGESCFSCQVCVPYLLSSGCIQISSNYLIANVGGNIGGAGGAVNWIGIKNEDNCFIINAITAGTNKNNVGIGTTCPCSYGHGGTNRVLEVHNCGSAANSQAHVILSTCAAASTGAIGSLSFAVPNSSASNKLGSYIGADIEADSSTVICTNLGFATRQAGAAPQIRLRIFSTGISCFACQVCAPNIVVNTTSDGFNMLCLVSTGGDAGIYLRGGATNTGGWTIQAQNACNFVIVDRTAGANPIRLQISSGGNLSIGAATTPNKLYVVDSNIANCGCTIARFDNSICNLRVSIVDESTTGGCAGGIFSNTGYGLGLYSCTPSDGGGVKFYTANALTFHISGCGRAAVGGFACGNSYKLQLYGSSAVDGVGLFICDTNSNRAYTIRNEGPFIIRDASAGVDRINLTTSGRLGIADSNPHMLVSLGTSTGRKLHMYNDGGASDIGGGLGVDLGGFSAETSIFFGCWSGSGRFSIGSWSSANCYSTKVTVNANGEFLVGTTTGTSTDPVHRIGTNGGSTYARLMIQERTGVWLSLNTGGANIGTVYQNGSVVVYGGTSDYRLKDNIKPMSCGIERVMRLKPVEYTWKRDCSYGEGFIAHELQEVVPLAVTGKKDGLNEIGEPDWQNVDKSHIVPILVKAIQELKCENDLFKTCLGLT